MVSDMDSLLIERRKPHRHYVESHFEEPLVAIFRGTGRACRGTRGVVMALARFDWELDPAQFPNHHSSECGQCGQY